MIAIILAIAFIYMVLASQFNSFMHPLTIMTSLPLSLPAGLLSLMAFGMTLNVYSAIGLMMLFGVVKKNSILQVDYTNTLRAQGMERHEKPSWPPITCDCGRFWMTTLSIGWRVCCRLHSAAVPVPAHVLRWPSRSSADRCSVCC